MLPQTTVMRCLGMTLMHRMLATGSARPIDAIDVRTDLVALNTCSSGWLRVRSHAAGRPCPVDPVSPRKTGPGNVSLPKSAGPDFGSETARGARLSALVTRDQAGRRAPSIQAIVLRS